MNKNSSIIIFFLVILIIFTGRTADESAEGSRRTLPAKGVKKTFGRIWKQFRSPDSGAEASDELLKPTRKHSRKLKQNKAHLQEEVRQAHQLVSFLLGKAQKGVIRIDMDHINGLLAEGVDQITFAQFQEAVSKANESRAVPFPDTTLHNEGAGGHSCIEEDVKAARAQSLNPSKE